MIIRELAETYQQLYLDPDNTPVEVYKSVVLRGDSPASCSLSHFRMDERDSVEYIDTPAGTAEIITLYDRHDFETFIRCMLAARKGPDYKVPVTMGASTIVAFNWPKIAAHRKKFFEERQAAGELFPDWNAEFGRFTANRDNYQDLLIVLSHGPYSNVSLQKVNELLAEHVKPVLLQEEWIALSDTVRKYHELTHFVCRKLYPDCIDEIWDELVADTVGIYAAFGEFITDLEKLFLGIEDGKYIGGRLGNYTEEGTDMDALADYISSVLNTFSNILQSDQYEDIFSIMIAIENNYGQLNDK